MANHGWVNTRKRITAEDISAMLADLNRRLFKQHLQIEYSEGGWGDHTWLLTYKSGDEVWAERVCWLENKRPRHFEMRHGGGGNFAWWVDIAILNEVAVLFGGKIGDDGVEEKWPGVPNKYDDLDAYLERAWGEHLPKTVLESMRQNIPPEFKDA